MKLSEYKNEDALDLLADIIEPISKILSDRKVQDLALNDVEARMGAVKYLLKNHKKSIIEIMARLDNVPLEKYEVNIWSLPNKLIELLNDKELISFFHSQAQKTVGESFGFATESTKEIEKT
jgi:hypothetical protein